MASDGGIFAFGDAPFYGSMGGQHLNQPIVGMAATPDGGGYWLVAADGGIFSFGDAHFFGSTGNIQLNKPIVGMTADPERAGLLVHRLRRRGVRLRRRPVLRLAGQRPPEPARSSPSPPTADGGGYWFANNNGAVTAYGDATYWGSAPQVLNRPVVGMAQATGTGNFTGSSYPSGSFGYDISNFQCRQPAALRPTPSAWSRWSGASKGAVNRCLGPRPHWAGGGLNLYIYLTYGVDPTSGRRRPAPSPAPHRPATSGSTPPSTRSPRPRRPGSTPRWPGGST